MKKHLTLVLLSGILFVGTGCATLGIIASKLIIPLGGALLAGKLKEEPTHPPVPAVLNRYVKTAPDGSIHPEVEAALHKFLDEFVEKVKRGEVDVVNRAVSQIKERFIQNPDGPVADRVIEGFLISFLESVKRGAEEEMAGGRR